MTDIPVPFTDSEVDTDDPQSGVMTVALLVVGFAVFSMASGIGSVLAQKANELIASFTGINPGTGESQGADLL